MLDSRNTHCPTVPNLQLNKGTHVTALRTTAEIAALHAIATSSYAFSWKLTINHLISFTSVNYQLQKYFNYNSWCFR